MRVVLLLALTSCVLLDDVARARAGDPCEDETGYVFRDGPASVVDGVRPQGPCLPSGTWQYLRQRQRQLTRATPAHERVIDAGDLNRTVRARWNQLSPEERTEIQRRLRSESEQATREKNEAERRQSELRQLRRRRGTEDARSFPGE